MLFFDFAKRAYQAAVSPPTPAKRDDAIRIGLLGASNIAPFALITPAKSHPEVIVAAVAARDRERARQYAKKYNIPIVHDTYQDILNDPSINAIYIALPNSLHYEWALRSIRAGKHVLLEKPSCSNAEEALRLFRHPMVTSPNAPVLLEAFHYQFHPAWQTFLSLVRKVPWDGTVEHVYSQQHLPKGYLSMDDIRFQYALSGGCLMDLATYPLSCVRQVLGKGEHLRPIEVQYRPMPPAPDGSAIEPQIDVGISATYVTDSGKSATIEGDLMYAGEWSFLPASWFKTLPKLKWPMTEAILAEALVEQRGDGLHHHIQRKVTLWNHLMPTLYHRIDVCDKHFLRREGENVDTWDETNHIKAYNWPKGDDRSNTYQEWWTTWRCQLEEFVNRIKGRAGSGVWIDGDESIAQMEAIDETYDQAGLMPRPTSAYQV
ncbi:NAD(P)-binding protein [Aspergillus sclerotioniger CBS 115572]|uniref:D-xylose 1-dehydrogenase (NADP(+), D-xylono-1,5-lactone-forming) n=1 Tax=Aspergillus sclerotioniger CBS 115572 TaxID=1450535 RepID=A0A317WVU7_9EURO|nr:NAD(P)-binding protein [Aspergillus sclerotioniger CBS 115572]PWY90463.1 NAD(P)-binding protein [Aspergillus sclerotioniger CBS 115572]